LPPTQGRSRPRGGNREVFSPTGSILSGRRRIVTKERVTTSRAKLIDGQLAPGNNRPRTAANHRYRRPDSLARQAPSSRGFGADCGGADVDRNLPPHPSLDSSTLVALRRNLTSYGLRTTDYRRKKERRSQQPRLLSIGNGRRNGRLRGCRTLRQTTPPDARVHAPAERHSFHPASDPGQSGDSARYRMETPAIRRCCYSASTGRRWGNVP
jgi:hypothetical protein